MVLQSSYPTLFSLLFFAYLQRVRFATILVQEDPLYVPARIEIRSHDGASVGSNYLDSGIRRAELHTGA